MGYCMPDCFELGDKRSATVNAAFKCRSLQDAEHFLASWESASTARTHLLTGIDFTWQTIAVCKYTMNALEDSVPGSHYVSRASINSLHRLTDSVYGIWSATLTLQMTYDPCNITRNVMKMFSDTVVASDVRRRDWSIGSLGTACVCSFSRPLRDIYSRCHQSPQRRREPAPRQMRSVIRGAASKCYCALWPVVMSKWTPVTNMSVVGILTRSRTGRCGVLIPAQSDLSLLQNVQNGCEAHPTSCSRGGAVSHLPSAEVKNGWSYTSTPPICLHGVCRNNFPFTSNHSLKVIQDCTETCYLFGPHKFTYLFIVGRYSDSLRAGRSRDRIMVRARFSVPVQYGPGSHPASCTMGNGFVSRE